MIVKSGKKPWRFDTSRNMSIDICPPDADVLVCTDLDEILLPGWRAKLEAAWIGYWRKHGEPPTTAQYEYVWNFKPDGSDGTKFLYEKVHLPGTARWAHPVHEILDYGSVKKRMVLVEGMRLEHHADPTKSRGQYLPLLEMSVREDPDDDRNMHYLGREYMFKGRWSDAIATLKRHLDLPRARWRAERAASMRFIARCEGALGHAEARELWLWRAVAEAPEQREAALELAELCQSRANKTQLRLDWSLTSRAAEICTNRKTRVMSYLTRPDAWTSWPWELLAIASWYSGEKAAAKKAHEEAERIEPENEIVKANDRWFC
jgi:tetratricopeptide (TPR) repeat protein